MTDRERNHIGPTSAEPNVVVGSDVGDAVAAAALTAPAEAGVPLVGTHERGLSPLAWGSLVALFAVALVVLLLAR